MFVPLKEKKDASEEIFSLSREFDVEDKGEKGEDGSGEKPRIDDLEKNKETQENSKTEMRDLPPDFEKIPSVHESDCEGNERIGKGEEGEMRMRGQLFQSLKNDIVDEKGADDLLLIGFFIAKNNIIEFYAHSKRSVLRRRIGR